MLEGSPWIQHYARNVALIALSLFFLPLDTAILFSSYAARLLSFQPSDRRRIRAAPSFLPKRILVTGVGMSKGLCLARIFYLAGHDVIGADFEPRSIPVSGRFSRALERIYRLTKPGGKRGAASYVEDLVSVIEREHIDLWVSCSGVASAVEDGLAKEAIERQTDCKAIQFDVELTGTLHEKDSFIKNTEEIGLTTPETHAITSRSAAHKVLHGAQTKKFIIKNVGVDDASRGDMTLLPRPTVSETYHHLSSINISSKNPWVLQQYIDGPEYCTYSLIVENEVKSFVACPSSELLMHYEALPEDSALSQAMLKYTQEYATRSPKGMTGHISFDFLVEETVHGTETKKTLHPIECNPRTHTAVVLFKGAEQALASAYLSAVPDKLTKLPNGVDEHVVRPVQTTPYYWIGHDLVTLVLIPSIHFMLRSLRLADLLRRYGLFLDHVLNWKDGTFEIWDPLPWWWLYHIYWPGQFISSLLEERRWSRINVSTTKVFGA